MAKTALADSIGDFTSKELLVKCAEGKPSVYYMRFTLHSIDDGAEDALLETLGSFHGYIAIEARSTKGELPDSTHFRRLVNANKVRETLEVNGYETLVFAEGIGMAQYGEKDPVVFRLIARKSA